VVTSDPISHGWEFVILKSARPESLLYLSRQGDVTSTPNAQRHHLKKQQQGANIDQQTKYPEP
jgi:hypothetical protein